ncbi:hypothetical protein cypCar_00004642, partial [Cyprinus carpio]
ETSQRHSVRGTAMATRSSGSPRTQASRGNSCRNILTKIRQGQITGAGLTRGSQFPVALLEDRDKRAQWQGIPVLLRRLHESSHPNSDLSKIHSIVTELSSLLSMEAMSFVTEERKTPQESASPNTYTFVLFGGVDLFVEILMRPTLTVQGDLPILSDDLIKYCLSVLYNCCICTEGVTKSLAAREDFVMFLFTLMSNKKVFLQTATLIEDILSVRKEIIQLEEIPNLANLVQSFNQQQLANFCRILSVTISEPDVGVDDKHTLLARSTQQKTSTCPSRAENNQVTLVNIPSFIERLCKLATRKVTEAAGASARLELEDWHSWLDNALVMDALMQLAIEEAEQSSTESSDESSLSSSPLRHRLPQSMKIIFTLVTQVHRMLAEFKLIPGLNDLFDKLIWRRQTSGHVLHRQNQNCDCSPEISFKIQFLRLLQSFSDHHENKYLLLSGQELNELSDIYLNANIIEMEALNNTDRNLVCDGKKGLLTRLISVMKKEPIDSSFRFWQARAVESFLRGMPSYADQVFLLRRGMLEENVSCLNTSLVILMLARRRGKLPFYLSALQEKEYAEKYPGCLLNNFHNLLRFWQHHYLNKDKDSTCLENSSCIPFTYWKETVSVLLGSGRSSRCAIATYIDEAYRDLDRDFLEL